MSKKETPTEWEFPKDARDESGAGQYPNYWTRKTRSGHVFEFDDSNGAEHITLQHRQGSVIQFKHDGSILVVAHNGQYNMVFGESRVKITGAQDITVDGDASLKVKGTNRMTVEGDMEVAVKGSYNLTAKSKNEMISENSDTVSGSETKKVNGSSTTQIQGAATYLAKGDMTMGSTRGMTGIGAGKNVGIKAGQEAAIEAGGKASVKSTGGDVALDGSYIHLNSGESSTATDIVQTQEQTPSGPQTEPTSDGTASV